ncbi:MAG: alkylation response protein AidB-like acyl-CoA dehydrogenase [Acidimicrobiales bacterium]|jgi:alkylation response protein AidB-like acyl-CoA dehydrogenase|tara:strand:- start:439 stop:2241 length:1803 start_codon:yes stop_codon:yes gene_type:complete
MSDYRPPLDDIRLVLDEISDITAICDLPGFEHVDIETIDGVLDELGRFVAEVVAPVNRIGDEQGCSVTDGVVTVPDEFGVAWDRFVESGWGAISQDPDYGGGGFPGAIQTVATELLATASRAWSMGPMLTVGAVEAIRLFGDEGLKETYLPKMVTSEWSGTMNLTEPQAGSDVGALTTRAVPQDDGTYRIFGTKIFITFGDHELTENIIQLVLARTPDSPPGTRGISLFIVPKYLVADDGSLGERNDYRCLSVEHKLGLHASPTCVLAFGDAGDGAVGYLLGDEHQGMKCMFSMMNNARLGVGIEGLAVTERALQQASDYAMERRQGRAIGGPAGEQAAIIRHADVRRMLLTMRAYTDAMRCLLYLNAATLDVARRHPDADTRQRAAERAELLTPISKAWCTDLGVEMTSVGIQVHGGYGYIEETGAAQHLRDARISPIYEGTNGIQAMDLVGRKLPMSEGAVIADLLADIAGTVSDLASAGGDFESISAGLADALAATEEATTWLMEHGLADPNDAMAGASPYLRMFGQLVGGWLIARLALGAHRRILAGEGDADFLGSKIVAARFYAEQLLPVTRAQLGAVTAGAGDLYAVADDAFSA